VTCKTLDSMTGVIIKCFPPLLYELGMDQLKLATGVQQTF